MKEYYASSKEFKVNGKKHKMKKYTLGLQADIEDDNIVVVFADVLDVCTDMTNEEIRGLHEDQLIAINNDIAEFTAEGIKSDGGEPKKP